MWAGRLFQRAGAHTEKARSPYRVRVRGPSASCSFDDERRDMEEGFLCEIRLIRYDGASS